jgi:hypothetical protein
MRVDFNQNYKQNPYFGIINFSDQARILLKDRHLPLDYMIRLQEKHKFVGINVTIGRDYDDDVLKSKKLILAEGNFIDFLEKFSHDRKYKNRLTAVFDVDGKTVTMKENPIMNFLYGSRYFLEKVSNLTEKLFLTGGIE